MYKKCPYYDKDGNCYDEECTWGFKYPCNNRNDCPTLKKFIKQNIVKI